MSSCLRQLTPNNQAETVTDLHTAIFTSGDQLSTCLPCVTCFRICYLLKFSTLKHNLYIYYWRLDLANRASALSKFLFSDKQQGIFSNQNNQTQGKKKKENPENDGHGFSPICSYLVLKSVIHGGQMTWLEQVLMSNSQAFPNVF